MKLTKLTGLLIAACIVVFSVNSCKKSTDLSTHASKKLKNVSDVTAPSVSNGMLVFESETQYNSWLNYLDELIARDSTSTDTTSQDSILHNVELDLSFTSLRQKTYEDFDMLNQAGWETIEEIPERHFIHDLSILSTLNQYGEVKIGSEIISFFDNEHTVIIKDQDVLSSVRTFKNSGYTDIEDIFEISGIVQDGIEINGSAQSGNVQIAYSTDSHTGGLSATKPSGIIAPIYGGIKNDPCNGKKIDLSNFHLSSLPDASWIINWGDGGGPQLDGFGKKYSGSHTYSSTGTYSVIIEAVAGGLSYFFYFNVIATDNCSKASKSKNIWYYPGSGWAVRGELECRNVKGVHRITANSESYLWNGHTNELRKCENLYAKVDGDILYANSNCVHELYASSKNSSHKAKTITASGNVGHDFAWNTLTSEHAMYLNGQWYVYYMTLTPCD